MLGSYDVRSFCCDGDESPSFGRVEMTLAALEGARQERPLTPDERCDETAACRFDDESPRGQVVEQIPFVSTDHAAAYANMLFMHSGVVRRLLEAPVKPRLRLAVNNG